MESLEVSARTVDEAVELALKELGAAREEVEITVLKKGRSGFLGLGAEEARVKVRRLEAPLEPKQEQSATLVAQEILKNLLSLMKVSASVTVKQPPQVSGGRLPIILNVTGDDLGLLIGRRGQTLYSLQYLVYLILSHQTKTRVPLVIDVEGYRERRQEALQKLAVNMAEQVKATGRPFTLEPMPPGERRIIHLALKDRPGVTTQSIGEGEQRRVVIFYKKQP